MASGKVKCSGSPMFLKKKFGTGHSIRLAKDPRSFEPERLSNQIRLYFPNSSLTYESNDEAVYQLYGETDDPSIRSTETLASLCDSLDNNLSSLGVTSYGISVTTLEDVFLKVGQEDDQTTVQSEDKLFELNKLLDYKKLDGLLLTFQRIKGLFMKRLHYSKRNYKTIGLTFILPLIVIIFAFLASHSVSGFIDQLHDPHPDRIKLDVKDVYGEQGKAVIRASFTNKVNQPFIDAYRSILQESGIQVIEIESSLSMSEYMETSSQNGDQFMRENIFGIIEDSSTDYGIKLWYNQKASWSLPLSIHAWSNALIRFKRPDLNSSAIHTTFMPMPNRFTTEPQLKSIAARVLSALFPSVSFSLIAVSYFLFPSIELQTKASLIQRMSGITSPMYWLGNYTFDIFYHSLTTLVIVICILTYDQFLMTTPRTFFAVTMLLMLHGLASISLFYLLSLLPMKADRGFSLLSIISIVGTMIGVGISVGLIIDGKIKPWNALICDLFPPFAMSFGLSKIYGSVVLYSECKRVDACNIGNHVIRNYCCEGDSPVAIDPFTFNKDGILPEIFMLLVDVALYTSLLLIVDMNLHRLGYWLSTIRKNMKKSRKTELVRSPIDTDDDDVKAEKARVKRLLESRSDKGNGNDVGESLIVDELTKDFGSFVAVDKVSFGVHKAECFGLLGVNGAGKTTTFRMLTGDIMITSGDAYVNSFNHWYSVRNNLLNFQQSISYCPQFDALIDNLTPKETLTLFARIRGMPENKVTDNVNYIIQSTDLSQFSQTRNQDLSGGNKRKLSLAIAAIAKPEVIFLDEPTTGVDPSSRRKIWSTLIYLRDTSGSSIVLTSHSMDECEALCSRIGIMARGNFKCLGSSQHLKDKFGQGFTLIIKMKGEIVNDLNGLNQVEKIKKFIKDKFSSSVLRDHHHTILHYHITDTSSRWGHMLRCLDEGKKSLPIEDFTLTGTSLEQIFLSFAKQS